LGCSSTARCSRRWSSTGFGWLGVAREPLDLAAVAGAAAVVAGAWLIVGAQAGAVLPVQGAVNAQLRAELGAPAAVGAFSFLVATAAMALALAAVLAAGASRPRLASLTGVPWWGWLGGLCGAAYVTSVFLLIPELGAAPVVALTVGGQQLASVAVDR
jgi:bacterial/archaeal transporter family-2 protein